MRNFLLVVLFAPFFSLSAQALEWKTDINEAIEISNKTRKPMLILFTANNMDTGLQSDVFKTYDFSDWSKKNVVLVRLDLSDSAISADKKETNIKLKNAFGVQQVPIVCFAKANIRNNRTTFQFIGKLDYDGKGFRNWINQSEDILNNNEY